MLVVLADHPVHVSAAREVKNDKQAEQVSGTAKRAALATQPWPRRSAVEGRAAGVWFCAKIELKPEIPREIIIERIEAQATGQEKILAPEAVLEDELSRGNQELHAFHQE
jgi:hypothetical protein